MAIVAGASRSAGSHPLPVHSALAKSSKGAGTKTGTGRVPGSWTSPWYNANAVAESGGDEQAMYSEVAGPAPGDVMFGSPLTAATGSKTIPKSTHTSASSATPTRDSFTGTGATTSVSRNIQSKRAMQFLVAGVIVAIVLFAAALAVACYALSQSSASSSSNNSGASSGSSFAGSESTTTEILDSVSNLTQRHLANYSLLLDAQSESLKQLGSQLANTTSNVAHLMQVFSQVS